MNATTESLQNSLQHAVRKVSQTRQVADAVLALPGAEYLHASDLWLKPTVRPLVKSANALSIVLADAYRFGYVGRVRSPRGRELFAYGALGEKAEGVVKRKVIKGSEKKVVGYKVARTFGNPVAALEYVAAHGGTVTKDPGGWVVTSRFTTAIAALNSLVSGLDGVAFEEVKE